MQPAHVQLDNFAFPVLLKACSNKSANGENFDTIIDLSRHQIVKTDQLRKVIGEARVGSLEKQFPTRFLL